MVTEVNAKENAPHTLKLTDSEAQNLTALGKELASKTSWWGAKPDTAVGSVIKVVEHAGGRYQVTFNNVVGVVNVGRFQFNVAPKIAPSHFWYIVGHSDLAPRISTAEISVDKGLNMIELLARWCVEGAEKILNFGLRKDYKEEQAEFEMVTGQIQVMESIQRIYQGAQVAVCRFEDFTFDAPINRVIKAACQQIASLNLVNDSVRARARKVIYRMADVGPLEYADTRVRLDSLTSSYSRVLPLSLLVLSGYGISSTYGKTQGLAFLVRTPELVEDGLRSILAEDISSPKITKRKFMLGDSGLSINPDLIFGDGFAIGDVKYKQLQSVWNKPDFNQLVTFATGFQSNHAILVGFASSETAVLPKPVQIGGVSTTVLGWLTTDATSPESSRNQLVAEVKHWLLNKQRVSIE
jgi:hypothetical protein